MKLLATIFALLATASAQMDDEFWADFENQAPYEHPWTNVPDLVNKTQVAFYFNMTHHFLLGVERGMYDNQSIELDAQCFGEPFITKVNELAVMWHSDPIKNLIPELALVYQLYFMLSDKCQIDKVINDFFLFCWNKGCYPNEIGANAESNYLYMTRSLIDASIVWMEGVPESTDQGFEQWKKLSHQTGETVSEIFKKFTAFETQQQFDA